MESHVFHTSGLCCTEEPTVGQNVLVAKCTCGTKMAWRENCAQSNKCVHNLYGQHCCDSSTICDLQQMCHLFPPTNSLLFSALMVRAQYLFTGQDKLQVATALCLRGHSSLAINNNYTAVGQRCCIMATSSHRQHGTVTALQNK